MGELLLLGHGAIEQVGDGGREIGGDLQGGVVAADGFFDLGDGQVRQVALFELATTADVIAIEVAIATLSLGVHEAVGASGFIAAVAEQVALEVVGEYPVALAALGAFVEHELDSVEELLANDCFVPPRVEVTVYDNPTGVIRVGQHLVQLVGRDRFGLWSGFGGPGHQAEICHCFVEAVDRVVAAGIQFPGLPHEWRPYWVETDGVEQAAVLFGADVEVADLGAGDSATVDGLIAQLGFDVLTVTPDFDFVEDVSDGFHGISHVALAKVLLRGDELDAKASQLPLGQDRVTEVPESPRAHVDDHVLDFRMLRDVGQQFPKDGPLLDALGGVTWLDEH